MREAHRVMPEAPSSPIETSASEQRLRAVWDDFRNWLICAA